MPEFELAGDVTFVVTTDWDDPGAPPTRDETIATLRELVDAYADLEFDSLAVAVATSAAHPPTSADASEDISARLRASVTDFSEARMTITGTTTIRIEESLVWEDEPSEERVRDILADEAPCSVLAIESIENVVVERTDD